MGTLHFYYIDENYGDPILLLYGSEVWRPYTFILWMRSMETLYFYYMDEKYGDPILL